MSRKSLILGASSFVGRHLVEQMGPAGSIGTFNSTPIPNGRHFDSTTMSLNDVIVDWDEIGSAVILMGDTQPDSCIADTERSRAVNITGIVRVIDELHKRSVPIVFTSTEFVFDGTQGDYTEADTVNPVLLYGVQKLEIERYLETVGGTFTVLRLAKVYGLSRDDGTLFTGMHDAVRTENLIRCAADQRFSPVYVGDVVAAIIAAINGRLGGTYHVAGPEAKSRLECLELMISAMHEREPVSTKIEPCSIHDFDLPEPRPVDVSMRSDKLVDDLGIRLVSPVEACKKICSDYMLMA